MREGRKKGPFLGRGRRSCPQKKRLGLWGVGNPSLLSLSLSLFFPSGVIPQHKGGLSGEECGRVVEED